MGFKIGTLLLASLYGKYVLDKEKGQLATVILSSEEFAFRYLDGSTAVVFMDGLSQFSARRKKELDMVPTEEQLRYSLRRQNAIRRLQMFILKHRRDQILFSGEADLEFALVPAALREIESLETATQ